jgi:ubiquinone biosynthesis protein COQ4
MSPLRRTARTIKVLGWFCTLVLWPRRVDKLIAPGNGKLDPENYRVQVAKARSLPGVEACFQARTLDPIPALADLAACPPDSLGWHMHAFFRREDIDPHFYPSIPVVDDASYLLVRCRQTHDIAHVLLDADTSIPGEIHVQGYVYAQTHARIGPMALAVGIVHTFLRRPDEVPALVQRFFHGLRQGSAGAPFLAIRWSQQWRRPLSEIRAELGLGGP